MKQNHNISYPTYDNTSQMYDYVYAFFYGFVQSINYTYDEKAIKIDELSSFTEYIYAAAGDADQFIQYMPPDSYRDGELLVDQRSSSGHAIRFKFTGKERDAETGFDYFGARYYSSDLSVWLSVDPLSDMYPSLSPYNYCALNPISYIDQNGDSIQNTAPSDFAGSVALINSLSEKTGLNLSYNDNNMMVYEKDESGNPVINGGSESARNDLIEGISDKDDTYSITWAINSPSINKAYNSGGRNGFAKIDFGDFSGNEEKTFDIGMIFLHEYNHGWFGLDDSPRKRPTFATEGKADFGAGIFQLGNPGPTVNRVNVYRSELGLPQRMTYGSYNGKTLFQLPNSGKLIWKNFSHE